MNTTEDGLTWIDIVESPEWKARELEWAAERAAYQASLSWWDKHSEPIKAVGYLLAWLVGMPLLGLVMGAIAMVVLSSLESAVVFGLVALLFVGGALGVGRDDVK
jgi:hypothetical protein